MERSLYNCLQQLVGLHKKYKLKAFQESKILSIHGLSDNHPVGT